MQDNKLFEALLNYDNFKNTKELKELIQKNDLHSIQVCTQTITQILKERKDPVQIWLSLRLSKQIFEFQNQEFISMFSTNVLPQMVDIAKFRKEDTAEDRGKYLFGSEKGLNSRNIKIIPKLNLGSVFLKQFQKYPIDPSNQKTSPYKKTYEKLLNQKVTFPEPFYYKDEDLTKKETSLKQIQDLHRASSLSPQKHVALTITPQKRMAQTITPPIHQSQSLEQDQFKQSNTQKNEHIRVKANKFLKALQEEQQLIEVILMFEEGSYELDMLDECYNNMKKFQGQAEIILLDLIELEVDENDTIIKNLLTKQDFLETFASDYNKWKFHKQLTFIKFQEKYLGICSSTPNPDKAITNPNMVQKQSPARQQQNQSIIPSNKQQQTTSTQNQQQKKIFDPSSLMTIKGGASLTRQPTIFDSQRIKSHYTPPSYKFIDIKVEEYNVEGGGDEKKSINPNQSFTKSNNNSPGIRQGNQRFGDQSQSPDQRVLEQFLSQISTQQKEMKIIHQLISQTSMVQDQSQPEINSLQSENNNLKSEMKSLIDQHLSRQKLISETLFQLSKEKSDLEEQIQIQSKGFNKMIQKENSDKVGQDTILKLTEENSKLFQDNKQWEIKCDVSYTLIDLLNRQIKEFASKPIQQQIKQGPTIALPISIQNSVHKTRNLQPGIFNRPKTISLSGPNVYVKRENNHSLRQRNEQFVSRPNSQNDNIISDKNKNEKAEQGNQMSFHPQVWRKLHPNFNPNSDAFDKDQTRTSSQGFICDKNKTRNLRPLQSTYKELIFPHLNPNDYYKSRILKPNKGRLVVTSPLSINILDQGNLINLKNTILKNKHTLFQSKYLMVGAVIGQQLLTSQKQINLGIYFINQNQSQQMNYTASYSLDQKNMKAILIQAQEQFELQPGRQMKHEIMFGLLDPQIQLLNTQVVVQLSDQRQIFYEFQLPITLFSFINFLPTNISSYKRIWRSNIQNTYRTEQFRINQNILFDGDEITKYIPELIGLNPHKKVDYQAGIDEIKYGGILQLKWNQTKFIVRFVITPTQEMLIQMAQIEGQKDTKLTECLINTVIFLFT